MTSAPEFPAPAARSARPGRIEYVCGCVEEKATHAMLIRCRQHEDCDLREAFGCTRCTHLDPKAEKPPRSTSAWWCRAEGGPEIAPGGDYCNSRIVPIR